MCKLIQVAVLLFLVFTIGCVSGEGTNSTTDSDILDCSNKPCEIVCPRHSTYRGGTNCTDTCDQRVCNTTMVCGCYCQDNFRKIDGSCVRKNSCPTIDGVTTRRPGIFGGGGLFNRRKNIVALMQKIRDQRQENSNR